MIKRTPAALLILLVIVPSIALAESGAAFLRIVPSPRVYALGGASSVLAFGAQAMGANPANLGAAKTKYEVFSTFSTLMNREEYAHAALALNGLSEKRYGIEGVGISYTQLSVSDMERRDRSGAKTGEFRSVDRSVALTASSLIAEKFRAGITGKILQSQLDGTTSGTAFAGDFGLNLDLSREKMPLSLGLSLRNAGGGTRYIDQTDPLPTSLDIGAGIGVGRATLIAEIGRMVQERETYFSTGMEFGFGPLSLRAGINSLRSATGGGSVPSFIQNFSSGLGFKWESFKFDYAVSSQGEFGLTHRAALTLSWGAPLELRFRPKIYELSRAQ